MKVKPHRSIRAFFWLVLFCSMPIHWALAEELIPITSPYTSLDVTAPTTEGGDTTTETSGSVPHTTATMSDPTPIDTGQLLDTSDLDLTSTTPRLDVYWTLRFPRGKGYESRMWTALGGDPPGTAGITGARSLGDTYTRLPEFQRIIGTLGLKAAEEYFKTETNLTPDQALARIVNNENDRNGVLGALNTLIQTLLRTGATTPQTVALRGWATEVFRTIKVELALGALEEYVEWKDDPCKYAAEGYTKPTSCGSVTGTLLSPPKSPTIEVFAVQALKNVSSNADPDVLLASVQQALGGTVKMQQALGGTASTAAILSQTLGYGASAASLASALGVKVQIASAVAAPAFTNLYSAFGGIALKAATTTGAQSTASIGTAGWAGVYGAPLAAVVFAITVGVTEALAVAKSEQAELKLKASVASALRDHIEIANTLADDDAASMFLWGFLRTVNEHKWKTPPRQIDGDVTFINDAAYHAKFTLSYAQNGQVKSFPTRVLPVGERQSFPIPWDATNIVAKGIMISAGEHEIFSEKIPRPTYVGYKVHGGIGNRFWQRAFWVNYPDELTIAHRGAYTARFRVEYELDGQPVTIRDNAKMSGWERTYLIPETATNIVVTGEGLGFSLSRDSEDSWYPTFKKTYVRSPSECIKVYGTAVAQRWSDCFGVKPRRDASVGVAIATGTASDQWVASQSSIGWGGEPTRAIDDNTNGNWANNSVTHTNSEVNPWWQLDLGAVSDIASIKIHNRTDCCSERLSNAEVFVSEMPFTSNDFAATKAAAGVHSFPLGTMTNVPDKTINVGQPGRYIRIQIPGTNYLSLAEVVVQYGKAVFTDGEKIALKAPDTGNFFSRCNGCVSTVGGITDTVTVHAPAIASYSTFTGIAVGDKIALKADTGNLVSRCNGCYTGGAYPNFATIHVPQSASIPAYALFTPVDLGNDRVALRADTGKYLARCNGCATSVGNHDTVGIHVDDPNAAAWNFRRIGDL